MAFTSSHPITVNGHRLDTWAYNIETKQGWDRSPSMRGANEVAAGRPGQMWVPKTADAGLFTLRMWVSDKNVDGLAVGSDRYHRWRKNLDTILSIFDTTYGPLDVVRNIGNGESRRALCDNVDPIDPEIFGQMYGRFAVAMDVLGAYWEDTANRTFTSPVGTGAIATHSMATFAGATAPMHGLTLMVTGPVANPRIVDVRTGHYVQYLGTLASGANLVINTAEGTMKVGTTNVSDKIVHHGQFNPAIWALAHAALPSASPQVKLEGSGAGAATRLQIVGRRKYK